MVERIVMKDNKVTRKIKRLELLQNLIDSMEMIIEDSEEVKRMHEQKLTDYIENESEIWYIENSQDKIEEYTIRLDEAKKLLAELEKMV